MHFPVPYTERATSPGRHGLWVLFLLAGLAVGLGMGELTPGEASLATMAREMADSRDFLATSVHGRAVQTFPFYPWTLTLVTRVVSGGLAVRLPAGLAVAAMAWLCFAFTRQLAGRSAAWVAALVPLTLVGSLRIQGAAGNDILMALFVGAAWLCWYQFGRIGKEWPRAWIYSLLLVVIASFAGGIRAWTYFYFPLLFLRRPLHGLKRMGMSAHFMALVPACLLTALWLHSAPEQVFLPWYALRPADAGAAASGYAHHLLGFLFQSFWLALPWGLLAWPIFCMAFRSVEALPVLCRYLRTILSTVFLTCLFLPGVRAAALLPLICPLAVAVGIHYEMLMRRHFRHLHQVARLASAAGTILCGAALLLGLLQGTGIVALEGVSAQTLGSYSALIVLAGAGAAWAWKRRSAPCWQRLVLAVLAIFVWHTATAGLLQPFVQRSAIESAALLQQDLPPQATVYKTAAAPLLGECYYLDRPVAAISSPAELPGHEAVVYVLGGRKPPILETRDWEPCSPSLRISRLCRPQLSWFPGRRCLLSIRRCPLIAGPEEGAVVRLYRATLRPAVEDVAPRT